MTPDEWDACTEPHKMLLFLRESGRASERRLRLFTCACCRRIWPLLTNSRDRRGVEVAELHADGRATSQEVLQARAGPGRPASGRVLWLPSEPWWPEVGPWEAARRVAAFAAAVAAPGEEPAQCRLLRDLFDPFRLAKLDASWLTPTVVSLAVASYEERLPSGHLEPARLLILADALLDAGCDDVQLLEHLRSGGAHWRGCFAVDAVLGKG
jgi:hypothetical protein